MSALIQTTVILFGLCIGSFLSVCVWRIPRKESVTKPARSYCTTCGEQLKWWHNIPLISYLILLGKCSCKKQLISPRYPSIELLTAFAAYLSFYRFGITPTGFLIFALTATLIVITYIDFDFKIIPNVITFPGMTFGLLLGILAEFYPVFDRPVVGSAYESLLGFLIGGGIFYVINWVYYLFSGQIGIGGGDIKLMAMLGAILGYDCLFNTLFVGACAGSVVGIGVMAIQGKGRHAEIPFGPWLAFGVLTYIFTDFRFFPFPVYY